MADSSSDKAELDALLHDKPTNRRWRLWAGLGLGVAALVLLLGRCMAPPPPPVFLTEELKRGALEVTVSATGNLAPTNQIDVGSELSGTIEKVLVDVNDRVAKGQILATLDTARLDDQVTRAQSTLAANAATVAQARATLAEEEAQLARFQEVARLSNGRAPSAVELGGQAAKVERARANLLAAKANVAAASAQLSSDRTQRAKAAIRAPVSGVVLRRSIDPGQTVQASFNTPSLFIIAEDLTRMKLEVGIDEADVARVREGLAANFTVDAYPGRAFAAKVSRVALGARSTAGGSSSTASSGSNVVSYLATLQVANADLLLRPGMTATAMIQTGGAADALLAPNAALRFTPASTAKPKRTAFSIRPPDARQPSVKQERGIGEGSRQVLYVLQDDDSLRAVDVITGPSDGRVTAVTPVIADSLTPGARIVTGQRARPAGG
jgi:HlyD family secretion protein